MPLLPALLLALRAAFRRRRHLVLENVALRHQLAVLRRQLKRPHLQDRDRRFWLILRQVHSGWRDCLHLIQPETVLGWHRKGWRAYWRRKSRTKKRGRPPIPFKLIHLIRRLARENPTWGAPHIRNELLLLGHDIGEMTVSRYMVRGRDPRRGQHWRTFLKNHMPEIAACDFFIVPTITFRKLFVLVILSHDRRLIRHVAVTPHPTSEWTARQLYEAFPYDTAPRMLIHDRDPLFEGDFRRAVEVIGIRNLKLAPRSPWLNGYCERVIRSIRNDCTDHIVALSDCHLSRTLRHYVEYYNETRPHLSLDGNAPVPRRRETTPAFHLQATPVLGGLHHRYARAA